MQTASVSISKPQLRKVWRKITSRIYRLALFKSLGYFALALGFVVLMAVFFGWDEVLEQPILRGIAVAAVAIGLFWPMWIVAKWVMTLTMIPRYVDEQWLEGVFWDGKWLSGKQRGKEWKREWASFDGYIRMGTTTVLVRDRAPDLIWPEQQFAIEDGRRVQVAIQEHLQEIDLHSFLAGKRSRNKQ